MSEKTHNGPCAGGPLHGQALESRVTRVNIPGLVSDGYGIVGSYIFNAAIGIWVWEGDNSLMPKSEPNI